MAAGESARRGEYESPRVAVIGAGLAGLAAAWRLQESGFDIRVFESDDTVGGRAATIRKQGYIIDTGAAVLASTYKPYLDLAREVGVEHTTGPTTGTVGIVRDGRIHLIDANQMIRSGIRTRLISMRGKVKLARLGFDILMAKRRGQLDYNDSPARAQIDTESSSQYATRVLSREISDYICDPVARTMAICDGDKVSKVEMFSGVANILSAQLLALDGGQNEMPQAVAQKLSVELSAPVSSVRQKDDGVEVTYSSGDGENVVECFDGAIVATTLPVAAEICPGQRSELRALDQAFGYVPELTVAIGTRVKPDCPAVVVHYPARENATIALAFLEHNKRPDRAPAGHALFTCYWEAAAAERMLDAPDDEIVEKSVESLRQLFPEAMDSIDLTHVKRWPVAVPNLGPGVYKAIAAFNSRPDRPSRIEFAGDFVGAPGQDGAVINGNRAAANLARSLQAMEA